MREADISHFTPDQAQIYRVARGWKVFIAVAIPPLAILFGWIMVLPFLKGRADWLGLVVSCIGAGMLLFTIIGFIAVFKNRIEVYPDRVRDVGLSKTTEILLDEIKGFRIISNPYAKALSLQPKDPQKSEIMIGLMAERQSDLLDWLNRNLTNLDEVDYQAEMKEFLHDERLGGNQEQRAMLLESARHWSKILNGLTIIVLFWAFYWPYPYEYAIFTLIILPWLALGSLHHFHGALKLDSNKSWSVSQNIAPSFILPIIALGYRVVLDYHILHWDKFWLPFAAVSLGFGSLLFILGKDRKRRIGVLLFSVFILAPLYGYAAVISLNGILDGSTPGVYQASVVQKRISRGKTNSYYLQLSPWGPRRTEQEVDVGRLVYERHGIGDKVDVIVRQGRLGIPWFRVR